MTNLRCFIITALMLLASSLSAANYRVTAEKLNVRQWADTSAPVVFQLNKDDVVEGESYGTWIEVRHGLDKGYAYGEYLEECPAPARSFSLSDFHFSWGTVIEWAIILVVAFFVLRFISRIFSIKRLIIAILGSAAAFYLLPLIGKLIFGFIGWENIGIALGYFMAFCILIGLFSTVWRDSGGYASSNTSGSRSNNDRQDNDDRQQRDYERRQREDERDYEERRRREQEREEEERREREEEERREREENAREADRWHSEYQYYRSKADSALSQAYSYSNDDDMDRVDIYMRDYEEYRSKAEYAYDKWHEYQNKS